MFCAFALNSAVFLFAWFAWFAVYLRSFRFNPSTLELCNLVSPLATFLLHFCADFLARPYFKSGSENSRYTTAARATLAASGTQRLSR